MCTSYTQRVAKSACPLGPSQPSMDMSHRKRSDVLLTAIMVVEEAATYARDDVGGSALLLYCCSAAGVCWAKTKNTECRVECDRFSDYKSACRSILLIVHQKEQNFIWRWVGARWIVPQIHNYSYYSVACCCGPHFCCCCNNTVCTANCSEGTFTLKKTWWRRLGRIAEGIPPGLNRDTNIAS